VVSQYIITANYAEFHAMKLSLRNGNLDDNTDNMDNTDNQGNQGDAETRSAKAVQQGGETNLTVYPNPTDDILYVELSGAGVQSAGLYDLQGRIVGADFFAPTVSPEINETTIHQKVEL